MAAKSRPSARNRSWCSHGSVATVLALLIVGCDSNPAGEPAEQIQSPNQVVQTPDMIPLPSVPLPLPALQRGDLLLAAFRAADAASAGRPPPKENADLVGRSFEVRQPFGCSGPHKNASEWAGWTYSAVTRALKVSARSDISAETPEVRALAGDLPYEAVEGFWIRRPWTSAESCPRSDAVSVPTEESTTRETFGIVQFFGPGTSRTLRRDSRPYSVTVRRELDMPEEPYEIRLALKGTVEGFADGQPIHCRAEASNLRPVCLMRVRLSRVALEDGREGGNLAEWNF